MVLPLKHYHMLVHALACCDPTSCCHENKCLATERPSVPAVLHSPVISVLCLHSNQPLNKCVTSVFKLSWKAVINGSVRCSVYFSTKMLCTSTISCHREFMRLYRVRFPTVLSNTEKDWNNSLAIEHMECKNTFFWLKIKIIILIKKKHV